MMKVCSHSSFSLTGLLLTSVVGQTLPCSLHTVTLSSDNHSMLMSHLTGGEPVTLRKALAAALPNAPPTSAQMVKEPAMLHTTLARLLQPPAAGAAQQQSGGEALPPSIDSQKVIEAVERISQKLCGLTSEFRWVGGLDGVSS
jgi:hypothetical protein